MYHQGLTDAQFALPLREGDKRKVFARGPIFGGSCVPDLLVTSSNPTPSTGHGGQFFQLISLSPGNTYQLKE